MQVLRNARVLTESGVLENSAVLMEDGYIRAIAAESDTLARSGQIVDLEGHWLLPGFIDTQVNGGGGVLFNNDPSVGGLRTLAAAHRRFGTTGLLPTLISTDIATIERAITAVETAIAEGVPGIVGIHIEGPFLNSAFKGVHDARTFRVLDEAAIAQLTSLKGGKTLVTLAPEMTTPANIRRLVDAGVIVAAGHSAATYATIRSALQQGLTGLTHLFNAMSPLTAREPGVVGAALEDLSSWCGLIVDGHHVDPAVLRISLRCKPRGRLMLVTDAMPSVGSSIETFLLQGETITVRDGVCRDRNGTLAGSNLDMASAVRNAMTFMQVDLQQAVEMASANPAAFLGLGHERGRIAPGYRADLVLVDDSIKVLKTWIAGAAAVHAEPFT
jgi:N-acetylglucosamine-6-phosphate deacetylase